MSFTKQVTPNYSTSRNLYNKELARESMQLPDVISVVYKALLTTEITAHNLLLENYTSYVENLHSSYM